jgi:hypothetical protein
LAEIDRLARTVGRSHSVIYENAAVSVYNRSVDTAVQQR